MAEETRLSNLSFHLVSHKPQLGEPMNVTGSNKRHQEQTVYVWLLQQLMRPGQTKTLHCKNKSKTLNKIWLFSKEVKFIQVRTIIQK